MKTAIPLLDRLIEKITNIDKRLFGEVEEGLMTVLGMWKFSQ